MNNKPPECEYQTVEYIIPQTAPLSPSLLMVIDTCIPRDDFISLKQLLVFFFFSFFDCWV
jgi:hypothetical protein